MTAVRPSFTARAQDSLALFADVLLLGVLTSIASLGVVTAYPAFVAACRMLGRRTREDRDVHVVRYLTTLGAVLRSGPLPWLVLPVPVLVVLIDLIAVQSGVPGAAVLTPVIWVIAATVVLVAVRAATAWVPGERWADVARESARVTAVDPVGSVILVGALVVVGGIGYSVPVLLPLLPGALALAAVAIDHRRQERLS